jgi:hypothetical protein
MNDAFDAQRFPHDTDLSKLVDEHLDHGPGYVILTGLDVGRHPAELCERLSSAIGALRPQDSSGTMVREVADRGTRIGEGATARYADSRFGGSLHTDGAEAPFPVPDCFALLCVRQAPVGGALRLVHVDDVVQQLAGDDGVLDTLRRPFHFDRRGDQGEGEGPTTFKPVLLREGGANAVTYLREYIEAGHRHPGVGPLEERQRAALDRLDEVLTRTPSAVEGKLRPGEFAVFANKRVLHGRTTFEDHAELGHKRLLMRTWIDRTASAA